MFKMLQMFANIHSSQDCKKLIGIYVLIDRLLKHHNPVKSFTLDVLLVFHFVTKYECNINKLKKDETKDLNHDLQRLNFQGHEQSSQTINKTQELYANQELPIK